MTNYRLFPANGAAKTTVANGRAYTCAANGFVDAPDGDAFILTANAWVQVAQVGSTAQRTTNPARSHKFLDTTLNKIVIFNGSNWADPATGASV
jgi:hypothetical protein